MIIDIDGLKEVNDRLGHQPGDNLIRRVADDPARAGAGDRHRRPPLRRRVRGADAADRHRRRPAAGRGPAGRRWPRASRRLRAGRGDDQRRHHDVRRQGATPAPRRSWSPPTRRCTGPRRRAATGSPSSRTRARRSARASAPQTTSARIRDALTQDRLSLATQPIRSLASGGDRALRAAAADDRRERRAAAGRLLHRGGRALRDGPGARPLGRRRGRWSCWPSASAPASRSPSTSTSPAPR